MDKVVQTPYEILISFSLSVYSEEGWLGHMAVLFQISLGNSLQFPIMDEPTHIPTDCEHGSFSPILETVVKVTRAPGIKRGCQSKWLKMSQQRWYRLEEPAAGRVKQRIMGPGPR